MRNMQPSSRKYILVDKRYRRYSAPDDYRSGFAKAYISEESEDDSRKSKMSVVDLSVLFENQSGSDSSLELDTTISRSNSASLLSDFHIMSKSECYDCKGAALREPYDYRINLSSSWGTWRTVLIIQALSCSVSFADVINKRVDWSPLPVNALALMQYLLLTMVWSTQLALREGSRGFIQVLRLSGLRYMFLALLHVEAFIFAMATLRHHTHIGNQMMDCVAASLSLIIAYVCMEIEFQQSHLSGFAMSFLGSIGMCLAAPPGNDEDDAVWGDLMRLGCGVFLCFNSLAEELIVKSIDTVEYLGMVGIIGCFISAAQSLATEKDRLWPKDVAFWCYLCTLSVLQFLLNSMSPKILRDVGSTGMHLSLLTSPFYFHIIQNMINQPTPVFGIWMVISFSLIIGGSYVYVLRRTSISKYYFYPVQITNENQ